jgi:hypothetical protein
LKHFRLHKFDNVVVAAAAAAAAIWKAAASSRKEIYLYRSYEIENVLNIFCWTRLDTSVSQLLSAASDGLYLL